MSIKHSQLSRQTLREELTADDAPLREIEGQLVIVAMTSGVARLARVVRAICDNRMAAKSRKDEVPEPRRGP
jgi:hypothetical protein